MRESTTSRPSADFKSTEKSRLLRNAERYNPLGGPISTPVQRRDRSPPSGSILIMLAPISPRYWVADGPCKTWQKLTTFIELSNIKKNLPNPVNVKRPAPATAPTRDKVCF